MAQPDGREGLPVSWMLNKTGFWNEDNEHCEITAVIDEGVGYCEFESLEDEPFRTRVWCGFYDEFSEDC